MDWNAIKSEYITSDTSYRKLSKKYGISTTSIGTRARAEGWCALKEQFLNDTYSETIEAAKDNEVKRRERNISVSDKLLSAIEKAVDMFLSEELVLDKGALKSLTGAVKDIKDIQSLKGDLDIQEQKARIDNLRRQSGENSDNTLSVCFGEDVEGYSK